MCKIVYLPGDEQTDEKVAWAVFNEHFRDRTHDKEDLIHEALYRMLKYKKNFDGSKGNYVNFASRLAQNAMLNYLWRERRNTFGSLDISNPNGDFACQVRKPLIDPISMSLRQQSERILNGLSHKRKCVIRLYYFNGRNVGEIAKMVNLCHQRVSQYISEFAAELRTQYFREESSG